MRFNLKYANKTYEKCGTFGKMIQQAMGGSVGNVDIFKFGHILMMGQKGGRAKLQSANHATIMTVRGVGAIGGKIKCLQLAKAVGESVR